MSEMFFGPQGTLRKRFGPIWMYIEQCYENEKNRIFSNFRLFSKPYDHLGPEISSRGNSLLKIGSDGGQNFFRKIAYYNKFRPFVQVAQMTLQCFPRGSERFGDISMDSQE